MDGRQPTYDELVARVAELEAQVASLQTQLEKALELLEEKTRSGKRQAAPFSKGPPKAQPKTPGRKLAKEPYDFLRQTLCSTTPVNLYTGDPGR
jgi:hypothetical protein